MASLAQLLGTACVCRCAQSRPAASDGSSARDSVTVRRAARDEARGAARGAARGEARGEAVAPYLVTLYPVTSKRSQYLAQRISADTYLNIGGSNIAL